MTLIARNILKILRYLIERGIFNREKRTREGGMIDKRDRGTGGRAKGREI